MTIRRGLVAGLLPSVWIVLVGLIAAMPWGASGWASFVMPFIVLGTVFLASFRHPLAVPSVLIFLLGLVLDITTQGPLGLWAFTALAVHGVAIESANRWAGADGLALLAGGVAALAVAGLMVWAMGSLYYVQALDPVPLMLGVVAGGVGLPVLLALYRRSETLVSGQALGQ